MGNKLFNYFSDLFDRWCAWRGQVHYWEELSDEDREFLGPEK